MGSFGRRWKSSASRRSASTPTMTGTNRARPGLDQALAAVRSGLWRFSIRRSKMRHLVGVCFDE